MPQWTAGQSGNPHGRKPGVPNKTTVEVRALARRLVGSRAYLRQLKDRLQTGQLAPYLEGLLWNYAWGRPPLNVTVDGPRPLPTLPLVVTTLEGKPLEATVAGVGVFRLSANGESYELEPEPEPEGGPERVTVRLTA